jgi:hypothetical protein
MGSASTIFLAGDRCENKASSDVQAPLRGARDQYSSIPRVTEEAKTCTTSFIFFAFRRIIAAEIE